MCPITTTGGSGSRPTKADGVPRRVAGDRSHGGAGQDPKWDRNRTANPTVAFPAAAVAHNAGKPEESKVTTTAKMRKSRRSSANVLGSGCQATRD